MAESLLRDLQCRAAKPRATVYRLRDGGGLFLQVRPTGHKYWQFRYTKPDGRESSVQIGPYPRVTLERARTARNEHQAAVARGDDPSVLRKQDKARSKIAAARSMTFKQCPSKYIEAHEGTWRNVKHTQQWTRVDQQHDAHRAIAALTAPPMAPSTTPDASFVGDTSQT
jgi:hypothetical protein